MSGADDPISGASSLMETARGLGELLKTGWRPSRTIILALWDGEEWGLLGSTEWAEKHDAELKQKAAVYINTDGTGKGWLNAGGSHGLQQFLGEVAKDVMDPRTGKPVFEEARRRAVLGEAEEDRKAAEADPSLRIAPLGSGSDFTPFLQHLTLSALNVGFGGESPGGVYHSAYDTIKWYQTYSDSDYSYGRTLSQLTGTLILRLADAPVLPFQFTDTADTLLRYVVELEKLARDEEGLEGRHEAGARRRRSVEGGRPGFREGVCVGWQGELADAAREEGTAATEQAAAHVGTEAGQQRWAAAARLVQAPDLRAGFLHRLRREDDAADSRGSRGRPLHRSAGRCSHRVGGGERARDPGLRGRSSVGARDQVGSRMSKTRLIEAVKTLDLVETKRILEAKPELLKVWNDQGRNLLHLACGANPKKLRKPESAGARLVAFLLDAGLDIEEEGGSGSDLCKPIWFATAFGRNATVVKTADQARRAAERPLRRRLVG